MSKVSSSHGSQSGSNGGSKSSLSTSKIFDEKAKKSVEALQWAEQTFGKTPTVTVGQAVAKGSSGMNQALGWMKGDKNLTTYGGVVPLHLQISARVHHICFLHPSLDPSCSMTKLLPGSESNEAVMIGNMASMIESEQRRLSRDGVVGDHFAGSSHHTKRSDHNHEMEDLKGVRRILVNSSGNEEDITSVKKYVESSINSKIQKFKSSSITFPPSAERTKKNLNFKDDNNESRKDHIGDKYSQMLFCASNDDYLNHLPNTKGWKHAKMVLHNPSLAKIGRYLPETSIRVPKAAISFELRNDKRRTKTTQPFVVESPHVIWGEGRDNLMHKVAEEGCSLVDLRPSEFLRNNDLTLAQNTESLIFVGSTLWIQYPPTTISVKYKTAPEIFSEALQQVDEIETQAVNAVMTGAVVATDNVTKNSIFKNAALKVRNFTRPVKSKQAQAQEVFSRTRRSSFESETNGTRMSKQKGKKFISPFRKKNSKDGTNPNDSVDGSSQSFPNKEGRAKSLPVRISNNNNDTKKTNNKVRFADLQEKPRIQRKSSFMEVFSQSLNIPLTNKNDLYEDRNNSLPPISMKQITHEQRTIENINKSLTSSKIQEMLEEYKQDKISGKSSFFLDSTNTSNNTMLPTSSNFPNEYLPIIQSLSSNNMNEPNNLNEITTPQSVVEDINKYMTTNKIDKMVREYGFSVSSSTTTGDNEDDDFFDAVSDEEKKDNVSKSNNSTSVKKRNAIPSSVSSSGIETVFEEGSTTIPFDPTSRKFFTSSTATAPISNISPTNIVNNEDEEESVSSPINGPSDSRSFGTVGSKLPYLLVLDDVLDFRIVDFPEGHVIASFPVSVAAILNKRTMEERVYDPHYPSELTVTLVQEPSIEKLLWGVEVTVTFRCSEVKQKNLIKIEAPSLDSIGGKKDTERKLNDLSNSLKKVGKSQAEIDKILERSVNKIIEEDEQLETAMLENQHNGSDDLFDGNIERQLFWDRNMKEIMLEQQHKEQKSRMNTEITFDNNHHRHKAHFNNTKVDNTSQNVETSDDDFNCPD